MWKFKWGTIYGGGKDRGNEEQTSGPRGPMEQHSEWSQFLLLREWVMRSGNSVSQRAWDEPMLVQLMNLDQSQEGSITTAHLTRFRITQETPLHLSLRVFPERVDWGRERGSPWVLGSPSDDLGVEKWTEKSIMATPAFLVLHFLFCQAASKPPPAAVGGILPQCPHRQAAPSDLSKDGPLLP